MKTITINPEVSQPAIPIGYQYENNATMLEIVPPDIAGPSFFRLDWKLPDKQEISTEPLYPQDGVIRYLIPSGLTASHGCITMQLKGFQRDETGVVLQVCSRRILFTVEKSLEEGTLPADKIDALAGITADCMAATQGAQMVADQAEHYLASTQAARTAAEVAGIAAAGFAAAAESAQSAAEDFAAAAQSAKDSANTAQNSAEEALSETRQLLADYPLDPPWSHTDIAAYHTVYPVPESCLEPEIFFETAQAGTGVPAPDNIRPITGTVFHTITVGDTEYSFPPVIGFSGDSYDVRFGRINREKHCLTLTGNVITGNWTQSNDEYAQFLCPFNNWGVPDGKNSPEARCSHFPYTQLTTNNSTNAPGVWIYKADQVYIVIRIPKSLLSGWDDKWNLSQKRSALNTWLNAQAAQGHPVTLEYWRETPAAESVAPVSIPALPQTGKYTPRENNIYANGARFRQGYIKSALHDMAAPEKYIICWGDSLTAESGWTQRLQDLSGITVYNAGSGGETARTIAARQGADAMTVNNIAVPAGSSPVVLASRTPDAGILTQEGHRVTPLLQGGSNHINPCKIGGIEGTLAWTGTDYADMNGTWTFTRLTPGTAVSLNRPTAIRTAYDRTKNAPHLMILFIGQNGGYTNINDLVRTHRLMIKHAKASHTIILGLSSGTAASRADYEAGMKAEFGRYFISLREYLASPVYAADGVTIASCFGLEDAGLISTAADRTAIAEGSVPPQLLTNAIHYTPACKTVIGNMLFERCKELNVFNA